MLRQHRLPSGSTQHSPLCQPQLAARFPCNLSLRRPRQLGPSQLRSSSVHRLQQQHRAHRKVRGPVRCTARLQNSGFSGDERWDRSLGSALERTVEGFKEGARRQLRKLDGLWGKFLPMCSLFFFLAFINTVLDSLANSLVITAPGGGTAVIPFLTVYAVLPSSFLFLVLYSVATQHFTRGKLFNIVVGGFLCFFVAFALLYPAEHFIHLHGLADAMASALPDGLAGLVGMVRNWAFTLFYCCSELWGDVALSLLFWGLANETTSLRDAPVLYPLFGVGANVAQTLAGRMLSLFNRATASWLTPDHQLQLIMSIVLVCGACVLALHTHICGVNDAEKAAAAADVAERTRLHHERRVKRREARRQREKLAGIFGSHSSTKRQPSSSQPQAAHASSAPFQSNHRPGAPQNGQPPSQGLQPEPQHTAAPGRSLSENGRVPSAAAAGNSHGSDTSQDSSLDSDESLDLGSSGGSLDASSSGDEEGGPTAPLPKPKLSVRQALVVLSRSPQIRCLAVMALAQGISTNLIDVAWKHHLHILHPTTTAYAAFMGEVAMWTGIVTGSLMFASPVLFDRLGWRGVAGATPNFMKLTGVPFLLGCAVYTILRSSTPLTGLANIAPLRLLVITGAILQVFSKGAKFSMFKPAEEMVYIGLDEDSRTKGKAAIDVVGAQTGKSAGSALQQILLLISGGSMAGSLPIIALAYFLILQSWTGSVDKLATLHSVHTSHQSVDETFETFDEEDGTGQAMKTVDIRTPPSPDSPDGAQPSLKPALSH